jgi:hypothetical protein
MEHHVEHDFSRPRAFPRVPRLPRLPRAEMIDGNALASCCAIEWGDRLRAADRRIEARDWATFMHR